MKRKQLGPVLLTGFIIGPILGSGIIILPPLAYELLGNWALPAWVVISLIGALFAAVFGSMSILFPGDSGVSECVAQAFGSKAKRLTAYYLMGAVCVGPVAVVLTAAKYVGLQSVLPDQVVGAILVCLILLLLLRRITALGQLAFVLSTLAATVLFVGSLTCLVLGHGVALPDASFEPASFGYGLLLLFWTVVGWEIIGNYSAEIRNPARTIPQAVGLSMVVIAAVTLSVAAAVQSVGGTDMSRILQPLFGRSSVLLLSTLTVALCLVTELAFTGAVARLMASLAEEGSLPRLFVGRNAAGAPAVSACVLSSIHLSVLGLSLAGLLNVEKMVAMADGFFLGNAIMALLAGGKLLKSLLMRWLARVLALLLAGVLAMSSWPVLAVLAGMAWWVLRDKKETLLWAGGK